MKKYILFFAGLVFLLTGSPLFAGIEKMNSRTGSSSIVTGGFVAVTDNKFPNVTVGGTALIRSSTAKVVLGLDDYVASLNYPVNSAFYLRVVVKISYVDASGNAGSRIDRLIINHTSAGATNDRSVVVVKNAHGVMARILGFEDNAGNPVSPSFIPSNIFLEAEVETDRIYTLNPLSLPVLNHSYYGSSNELEVYWNSITGAEEYELEYTFINNYSASSASYNYFSGSAASISSIPTANLAFSFNNNATRIRTGKNKFRISLTYNQGLLVYRVRTVGRSTSNPDLEVIGDWTLGQAQTTLSMTLPGGFNDYYLIATGHETNKNWQAATSFAEDGKKKDVVSYFDGSNRKRQVVTRNNSDNISLVSESIYDSQGRLAITVLPAPSFNSGAGTYEGVIRYFEAFNQSSTQAPAGGYRPSYNKVDFESISMGSCPVPATGMFTGGSGTNANGASLYYSVNNTLKQGQDAYLPDALQYPFTQKIYTPDNTNRLRYESGLGSVHRIGAGRETKYLYGDPDQDDLDRLFGSEAGYAEKYKKTMTVDPNVQISVSYLNTEGKVVATALAGNAPSNVNQLSNLSVYPKSVSYMDYQYGNYSSVNLAANGALTFKKKILPDISGNYTFFYDLTAPQFTDNCIPNFCYDCIYDLEISIKDECDQPIFTKTVTAGTIAGPVNYVCASPIYFSSTGFSPAFVCALTAGKEYYLSKVLTINKVAQDQYLEHYLTNSNNSCLKDISYFQNAELASVDYNDCHMSCASCSTKVEQYYLLHNDGSKADPLNGNYDPNYIYMSPVQKQKAIDQCQSPCKPMGICEAEFRTMLQDVRPMGQYAQYDVMASGSYSGRDYQLSLFADTNYLRISTIYDAPTQYNGTPFVSYNVDANSSHWRYPEYYNSSTRSFASPDPGYSAFHYFDNYGSISKIRIVKTPSGGYFPAVVSTAPSLVFSDAQGYWTFPENLLNLKDFILAYANNPQWAYSLVKNHPEFNYFLDCDRLSNPTYAVSGLTSDQFDVNLRMANTYAAANSSWGPIYGNSPNDLISADPFFNSSLGSSYFTAFQSRLNNYKGSGISIKQICAQMYSSSQMYYSPASCASAATFGGTSIVCNSVSYSIPAASLDAMWKAYREMYLAEKAVFIREQEHLRACNPTGTRNNYFNGAIGDQNFSPYPAYASYSFFPFFIPYTFGSSPFSLLLGTLILNSPQLWPNYTAAASGFSGGNLFHPNIGLGYFDYGSPSSIYHKGRYANKVRRVPDTQTLANALANGASDPASIMDNLNQNAETDMYFSTNQCPMYKRLELFLSRIAQNGSLFQFGGMVPLVSEPAFTKHLYDGIVDCGGLPGNTWIPLSFQPTLINSGSTIRIQFFSGVTPVPLAAQSDIFLNNLGAPIALPDWNNIRMFTNIFYNGQVSGTSNFMIKAMYEDTSIPQPYDERPFSGSTCLVSNCNGISDLANGQLCHPTETALQIQNFLSAVVNDVSTTGTNPINLGLTGNYNSPNYFTQLVRHPFGTQAVTSSPVSHSVVVLNTGAGAQISISGKDPSLQNVFVNFNFTPQQGAVVNLNLVNCVGFSNLMPLQTANPNYDFTIKAYYNTAGNPVQTFSVKVNYGYTGGGCTYTSTGSQCRFYTLKTCEEYVPLQCSSNNNYKTKVQLEALLNEMLSVPVNQTVSLSYLANYTNLLQSQIGNAQGAVIRYSNVVNPVNSITDHQIDFCFFSNTPLVDTTCKVRLVYNSVFPPSVVTSLLYTWKVLDIAPVAPLSTAFTATITDVTGGNVAITGSAPCLKMQICPACATQTVLFEDFERYNSTGIPPLNFSTSRYDAATPGLNPPVPCVYTGFNNCPNLTTMVPIPNFGDYSVLSNTTCMLSSGFPDHTPSPGSTNYLVNNVWYPAACATPLSNLYVVPWQTVSFIATAPGEKYKFSAYFLHYPEICFEVQLIAEEPGTGIETIIASKKRTQYTSVNYTYWENLTGYYIPRTTTTRFKIKVLPTLGDSYTCPGLPNVELYRSVAFDDIAIERMLCSDPEIVPIAVTDPDYDDCFDQLTNIALANGKQSYKRYITDQKQKFLYNYTQTCYKSLERLQASYQSSEGHYTLYYYDQAGNLIKTIPPEGVEPINLGATDPISGLTWRTKINADRDNRQHTVFTGHRMATRYEYNSLNQLIRQQQPDHANTELYNTSVSNSIPANVSISGMDFSNSQQGYAIGSNPSGPVIYVTNNGGGSWNAASSISSADIVDIEYSNATLATAILADGTVLQANPYNVANPVWTPVTINGSSSMQFTDIESDNSTNPPTLYICGKNGLFLNSTDNGANWNTIPLGTPNHLNRIAFASGFGVVVGDNGTVFRRLYSWPAGLTWNQFFAMNNSVDLQNVAIVEPGDGFSTFMNVVVSGADRNLNPARGTVINIRNLNGPSPVVANLYLDPNPNLSSIGALTTNTYVTGSVTFREVFYGGVLNNPSPAYIMGRLQSQSPTPNSYVNTNISITAVPAVTEIKDLAVVSYGSASAVRAVSDNGYYIGISSGSPVATPVSLSPALCNRIAVNGNLGHIVGKAGVMLSYNVSPSFVSTVLSGVSMPTVLNAVSAAKDGSGKVYIVGANGGMLYSTNFGNSWTSANTGVASNLTAVRYVPGANPKAVIAGSGGFVTEFYTSSYRSSPIRPYSLSGTYINCFTIANPSGDANSIFLGGTNSLGTRIIERYNSSLPTPPVTNILSTGSGTIRKMEFTSNGVAYAVGNAGIVLKSIDNGVSFNPATSSPAIPGAISFNELVVIDEYNAWAFGSGSTVLKTTDGTNWNSKTAPGSMVINAAVNFGNGNLLAAGSGAANLFSISDQSNDYSARFFYDGLGRLIISQNSKQFNKVIKAYSYTLYDAIGRVIEVGELSGPNSDPSSLLSAANNVISQSLFNSWLASGTKSEVTSTVYDVAAVSSCSFSQDNLRKRVSASYLDNDGNLGNGYSHATYYSYDIHGNVKSLMQENTAMPAGHTCKRLNYGYDLLSGKVNYVDYQAGYPDAWHHKYEYDADNRLTHVYTSKDKVDWTRDAKYFYYLHGSLSRVELGQKKVQGTDYIYTLQGWMKGLNSVALDRNNDPGKDGLAGTSYNTAAADLHKYISDDAVAYALHYYGYNSGGNFINDYRAIEPAKNTNTLRFDGDVSSHSYFTSGNSLFNGNIMAMATTIYTNQPNGSPRLPLLATYKYDQLNRVNTMNTSAQLSGNIWSPAIPANLNNYRNDFSYDPNGNIQSQKRYDNAGVMIDNMAYQYQQNGGGRKLANRLYHVNDGVASAAATGDIDDQGVFNASASSINAANNYGYDEIGNMTRDNQEGIASIDWTVYGKIGRINRTGPSTARNIIFAYDAAGNRVSKTSYTNGQAASLWQTTYYVRDAQGNIMATYEYKPAGGSGPLTLNVVEHPIYGSVRVGQRAYYDQDNVGSASPYITSGNSYSLSLQGGNIAYEIGNHLHNVLTIVSDRKIPVPNGSNPNLVDRYIAEIISASDYYPFGQLMPRRQYVSSSGAYRYGFNGKENDNEVKGNGNSLDYGARIYDPRLGRWLSMDPQCGRYPFLSSFASFGNSPMYYVDPGGETLRVAITGDVDRDIQTREDIRQLLPDGKASMITFASDGTVKFNVSMAQAKAMASKDPGVALVFDLVNAKETIVYEVNDRSTAMQNGKQKTLDLFAPVNLNGSTPKAENLQVDNQSVTPLDKNGVQDRKPIENGVHGKVVIDPFLAFVGNEDNSGKKKNREAIVFHELAENYERTVNKSNYDAAHNAANARQDKMQATDRRRDGKSGTAKLMKSPNMSSGNDGTNTRSKQAKTN